jgi:hypothetical protein
MGADTHRPLHFFVDLVYPGYLRYFDSLLLDLAARGHRVELWFDNDTKQSEGLQAISNEPRITIHTSIPKRRDSWGGAAQQVRRLADFVRYLDPRFADAHYLRERVAKDLPRPFSLLRKLRAAPTSVVEMMLGWLSGLERSVPRSRRLDQLFMDDPPDVIIVSPYVFIATRQVDLVASAKAAGARAAVAIASWDNLTTKGLIRGWPEAVIVWNDAQRTEAVELHGIPPNRVIVTGAQSFDKWFDREPSLDRAAFAELVGLRAGTPYLLFVGSTESISAPSAEQEFVRAWIRALRASDDEMVSDLGILVRPHPYNSLHWSEADLSEFGNVTIWPRAGANPVDEGDRDEYFNSIYHSAAVIGINTSAMIESAIIGRPVLTITPPEFVESQGGTLHFRHLLPENGGFVRRASSLDVHCLQLSAVLHDPSAVEEELREFVERFIRPHGLSRPATPIFTAALESLAETAPRNVPGPTRAARAGLCLFLIIDWLDVLLTPHRLARALRRRGRTDARRLRQGGLKAERALSGSAVASPLRVRAGRRAGRLARRTLKRTGQAWKRLLFRVADRIDPGAGTTPLGELVNPGGADESLRVDERRDEERVA